MKNIIILILITIFFNLAAQSAEQKKSTLEKFVKEKLDKSKKIEKNKKKSTLEKFVKEKLDNSKKKKRNKSTLEKWISGEKKIKDSLPNIPFIKK
tara:strand:+ start:453 stop:737 length:285 start_codon:yes stop_codon:yes gene_type:complete